MKSMLKHTPLGYFNFFYEALGNKLIFNVILAVLLGLMDGIGLALFIPMLQFVNDTSKAAQKESMGGMDFIFDMFDYLSIPFSLLSILVLMVIIFTIKGLLNYWLLMEQVDLRQKYMVTLRLNQIEELKNLSYQGFLKLDAGRIQNGITVEVGKNLQALKQFLSSLKSGLVLGAYVGLAFLANWQFALFICVGGYFSNFIYKKIIESVKENSIKISKRGNLVSGYIIQGVHNFKYLKATNQFAGFSIKLRRVIRKMESLNRKIGQSQAVTSSTREPVIIFIVAVVILLQVNVIGSALGSILLSLLLFYRALNGLVVVQSSWQTFMQAVGGLQAVSDLRIAMRAEEELLSNTPYRNYKEKIELRNISFSYGKQKILRDINLSIFKNQTIALVGESGSGKSTLANIITTLLRPIQGDVLIDGENLYNYNLNSFRKSIGYITQESVIFSDNIFNNVTFWAEPTEANVKRFWEVIEKVSLYDYINGLELKEKTLLGDNGMFVSGGQKQRISIARELFKNVEILILDEATSALDSQTEHFIQRSIEELQGEFTMLIIAHRLSTIRKADAIYILNNGEIIDSGSYNHLIGNSESFQKMVSLQQTSVIQ